MCGIAGICNVGSKAPEWQDHLSRMAHAIHHRGPDDGGIWFDASSGVGLANRRLAIVDLSPLGHQPMVSPGGRFVITFNGEIYNFRDIRADVLAMYPEVTMRGHSDTETFLAAIECWGVAGALDRVVGMFGFALWDRQEHELVLGRDRMGEKPLYYGWNDDRFLFGSELKSIRAVPGVKLDINRDALALYFRHMYIPAPYSIYDGIYKLPPGHVLTLSEHDRKERRLPAPVPYWSALDVALRSQAQPFSGSETDAVEMLDQLVRQAVGGQMVADVPVGVLLSGGIDSSVVTALMCASASGPVRTFTIGSSDATYDESGHARAVAEHLGTEHTELVVTPAEVRSVIPRLPAIYDEPFADQSQIPTLIVSELARRSVTVALSGDGGDELFGGYSRHVWAPGIWNRLKHVPPALRGLAGSGVTAVSPASWDRIYGLVEPVLPRSARQRQPGRSLHKLGPLLGSTSQSDMYQRLVSYWDGAELVNGARTRMTGETDPELVAGIGGFAQRMMVTDLLTFLPDDVLAKVDRASMAVSLETRAPLLDHRVVSFALSLPAVMNLQNGVGKHVLRGVLQRYVPQELFDRPKSGFGVPVGDWLKGPLREWAETLLSESRLVGEGFLRPEPVQRKWAEHCAGRNNWTYQLWSVLMFGSWLEREALGSGGDPVSLLAETPMNHGVPVG